MKFLSAMVTLGVLWLQVSAGEAQTEEKSDLIGAYRVPAGERDGQKIAVERLKDVSVRITSDTITTFDKDENAVYVATYEVDTGKRPWQIMMVATVTPAGGKGTKAAGLIAMDGNIVKFIYALPGGETPTEFKANKKQQMFILKKLSN